MKREGKREEGEEEKATRERETEARKKESNCSERALLLSSVFCLPNSAAQITFVKRSNPAQNCSLHLVIKDAVHEQAGLDKTPTSSASQYNIRLFLPSTLGSKSEQRPMQWSKSEEINWRCLRQGYLGN